MLNQLSADRRSLLTFAACVVAEILLVLAFDPFPTVDTAAHLASARTLGDVISGGSAAAYRLLEWRFLPVPNLLPQLILAVLVAVVGSHWAERLILLGYIVSLSAGTIWALRPSRPAAIVLAFFVLPLTFNLPFLWGFLNFSYSIAGFLFIAGLLLRWDGQLTGRRTMALAVAMVVVFFIHMVGYLEAGLLAVCILGAACVRADKRLVACSRSAVALAPGAILTLVFLVLTHSNPSYESFHPLARLKDLVALTGGIVAYDWFEIVACLAASAALGALTLAAVIRGRWGWLSNPLPAGLAAFVVASSLVAVFAPEGTGSGAAFGEIRYPLFPVLGLILWLAYQPLPRRMLFLAATVAALSALDLTVLRYDKLRAVEASLRDLRALNACVPSGSTVVQANYRLVRFGSVGHPDPLTAEVGRLAAARGAFDLGNIDFPGPFGLLLFRPATNPYGSLVPPADIEAAPPQLDMSGFEARTGIPVDYVVLFGRVIPKGAVDRAGSNLSVERRRATEFMSFQADLNADYVLAKVSPRKQWELWARKSLSSTPGMDLCPGNR